MTPSNPSSQSASQTNPATRYYKPMSRKVIAAKYGIDTKTFRRWCECENLKLPSGMLPPNQVRRIVEVFGEWEESAPAHKSGKNRPV